MEPGALDDVARDFARGLSRRRLLGRFFSLAAGAVAAPASAALSSALPHVLAPSASAQTVTPDLGITPAALQPGVLAGDDFAVNFASPNTAGSKPYLAHAVAEDPKAFPTSWLRVHNQEGVWGTQRLWLAVTKIEPDAGVTIRERTDYAKYNLIAAGGDARYRVQFPDKSISMIRIRADAATKEAIALTIFQNAVHAGLIAAGYLLPDDADIASDLAQTVIDKDLDQLDTFQPCADAIGAVLNESGDQNAFVGNCQACLKSPLWVGTVNGLLAKLSLKDWFVTVLKEVGKSIPVIQEIILGLDVSDIAISLWNAYQAAKAHVPGEMANTVWFMGFSGAPPTVPNPAPAVVAPSTQTSGAPSTVAPGGLWLAPNDAEKEHGPSLAFAARAYPTEAGNPAINRVEFTAWWPGLLSQGGQWARACVATNPSAGDHFSCTADLKKLGAPAGPVTISFDVYDEAGNRNLAPNGERTIAWIPDPAPKITSGPDVANLSQTSATVTWVTDQTADGRVDYGLSSDYGQSVSSHHRLIHHHLDLINLAPNTTYHYRVRSMNANGEAFTKKDRTFTTAPEVASTTCQPGIACGTATDCNDGGCCACQQRSEQDWVCAHVLVVGTGGCGPAATCGSSADCVVGSACVSGCCTTLCTESSPTNGAVELPASYIGTWSGTGVQTSPDESWPVTLEITGGSSGEVVGTSSYPSLGCSGQLTFAGMTPTLPRVVAFTETITVGQGTCVDGMFTIEYAVGTEGLSFRWTSTSGGSIATGTLTQEAPSTQTTSTYPCPTDTGECGPYVGNPNLRNYCSCSTASDGGICLFTFGTNVQCRHQTACASDSDCPSGYVCLQTDWCAEPLCFLTCEAAGAITTGACAGYKDDCATDSDCCSGYSCGHFGGGVAFCTTSCSVDADCQTYNCQNGLCAPNF